MRQLSPHFHAREFRSRDGAEHAICSRLIEMLELLRADLGGNPVTITSGYRSPAHNARVGGARNSYHTRGMAADIRVANKTPQEVYDAATRLFPTAGGIGIYIRANGGWVHIDSRPSPARWRG